MKRPLSVAALLVFAVAAGPVSSAVLTLDCRVQSTKPGYSKTGIRRLVIDLSRKTVQVSDNTGRGFAVRGVRPLVSADANRIVLENSDGKSASVDRRSGQYDFRNDAEKLVIRGRCAPASRGPARFLAQASNDRRRRLIFRCRARP